MDKIILVLTVGDVIGMLLLFIAMAVIGEIVMTIPVVKKLTTKIVFKMIDLTVFNDEARALIKEAIIREEMK